MARGLLLAIGATAVVAAISLAFDSLGKTAPEFKPTPSDGKWVSEEEFVGAEVFVGTADELFSMPSATGSTSVTPSSKL